MVYQPNAAYVPITGHSAGNVFLDVLVKDKIIPRHTSPIDGRVFVEGRDGSEFVIRVRNQNNHRVLVLISVDGLSVLDGGAASEDSTGYVLNAFQTMDLPGWTLNNEAVAKFTFAGKKGGSYVEQIGGDAVNKGVIGVLVYDDKNRPRPRTPTVFRSAVVGMGMANIAGSSATTFSNSISKGLGGDDMLGGALSCAPQDMGTGFGDETEFKTVNVDFERGAKMGDGIELFYDDRQGLKKHGIVLDAVPSTTIPKAFPGTGCKVPPNWTGASTTSGTNANPSTVKVLIAYETPHLLTLQRTLPTMGVEVHQTLNSLGIITASAPKSLIPVIKALKGVKTVEEDQVRSVQR